MSFIDVNINHLASASALLADHIAWSALSKPFIIPALSIPVFLPLDSGLPDRSAPDLLENRSHTLRQLSAGYWARKVLIPPAAVSLFTLAIFNIQKREVELWSN